VPLHCMSGFRRPRICKHERSATRVRNVQELAGSEAQVKELQQRLADGQQSLAATEKELCDMEKEKTSEQIAERMEELTGQCEALETQLVPLRGASNLVSKEDLKKREKRFETVFGEYRKRKRMFKGVFDQVLESSEKKLKLLQARDHHTAVQNLRIVMLGFGTGRQKSVLERGTNPKLPRRTSSSRYGLQPTSPPSLSLSRQDEIGIETDESVGLDSTQLQFMFDGMVKKKTARR
jgi:hypothetical protein